MALVRRVTVTFEDQKGKISQIEAVVPSSAFAESLPAREQLARPEIRQHFDADLSRVLSVEIGDEWDPTEGVGFLMG